MVFNREVGTFAPLPTGALPTDDELSQLRRQARAQGFRELRQSVSNLFRR